MTNCTDLYAQVIAFEPDARHAESFQNHPEVDSEPHTSSYGPIWHTTTYYMTTDYILHIRWSSTKHVDVYADQWVDVMSAVCGHILYIHYVHYGHYAYYMYMDSMHTLGWTPCM